MVKNRIQSPHRRERLADEDHSLMQRVKAGDHAAFETLFHRHASRVYRQAAALLGNEPEAEEVMQEVFLTVYTKAGTFRGAAAFSTWLYRLTANAALTRLRQRKRRREISLEDYLPQFQENGHHLVQPVADWSDSLDDYLNSREVRQFLREALESLPPMDKAVVVLSDIEGLPNQEIGAVLGLTLPAVKARLHRARLYLRGRLAVHFGHSPT